MDSPPGRQTLAKAAPSYLLQRRRGRGPLYLAGQSGLAPPADLWRGPGRPACLSTHCLAGRTFPHAPGSLKTTSASLRPYSASAASPSCAKTKGASSDAPLLLYHETDQ